MNRPTAQGLRHRRVTESFTCLPERYMPPQDPIDAIVDVELTDAGRSWRVELDNAACSVGELEEAAGRRTAPTVTIAMDTATWLALRAGKVTGLEAFGEQRIKMRGDLPLATRFQSLFRLPGGRPPRQRVRLVRAGSQRISTLTSGNGREHVLLIHGLGADKASFFPTINSLSAQHTVHAIDLPGFGDSSKPAAAPYDAPWFARRVRDLLDSLEIEQAHVVGNSMGGRVAIELGLREPDRVASLSLLAPAMAWRRRRAFLPIVRMLRPELSAVPHPLLKPIVREQVRELFADPDAMDPELIDITAEEFLRGYRDRNGRIAFYKSARNIYLDEPFGSEGMWTRLKALQPPALFLWGDKDKLVPAAFAPHCEEALPNGRSLVLENCGHVPQIEAPDLVHPMIAGLIEANPAVNLGTSRRRWPMKAAS